TRLPPPCKIWLWEAQVVASPAPRACVPAIARDRHRLQHEAAPTMQRAKATPGAALAARITKRARNFGGVHGTDTASFRGRPRLARRRALPRRAGAGTGGRHHLGTMGDFTRN